MTLQRIEMGRPITAERRKPGVYFHEGLRPDAVEASLCIDSRLHEARLTQHPQMLGDAGLAEPELVDQLADRVLALAQQVEDPAPAGVGQHIEDGGHEGQYDR